MTEQNRFLGVDRFAPRTGCAVDTMMGSRECPCGPCRERRNQAPGPRSSLTGQK